MSDEEKIDRAFMSGFAIAVGTIVRLHDMPTMARDICTSNGFDVRDFRKAKIPAYDLEAIRKAFKA